MYSPKPGLEGIEDDRSVGEEDEEPAEVALQEVVVTEGIGVVTVNSFRGASPVIQAVDYVDAA